MKFPIKLRKSDVIKLIAASFPTYKGRLFHAVETARMTFSDLNWEGGSRSQYVILDLKTGRRADMTRLSCNAPWCQPMEGASVDLPPGMVVVEHAISCGSDRGLTFHYNAADAAALGASTVALPTNLPAVFSSEAHL